MQQNNLILFLFKLSGDDEKLKLQQQEATRRENVLLMRLATKEQEMQEFLVCNGLITFWMRMIKNNILCNDFNYQTIHLNIKQWNKLVKKKKLLLK